MQTIDMEYALYAHEDKMGNYLCREVGMPSTNERVDYLRYNKTNNCWYFYELKLTYSDFKSACNKTFLGHYNYFVVPMSLYEKIKNEVDEHVGIVIVNDDKGRRKTRSISYIKKAKKQELKENHDSLLFALMQALSRENNSSIKISIRNV